MRLPRSKVDALAVRLSAMDIHVASEKGSFGDLLMYPISPEIIEAEMPGLAFAIRGNEQVLVLMPCGLYTADSSAVVLTDGGIYWHAMSDKTIEYLSYTDLKNLDLQENHMSLKNLKLNDYCVSVRASSETLNALVNILNAVLMAARHKRANAINTYNQDNPENNNVFNHPSGNALSKDHSIVDVDLNRVIDSAGRFRGHMRSIRHISKFNKLGLDTLNNLVREDVYAISRLCGLADGNFQGEEAIIIALWLSKTVVIDSMPIIAERYTTSVLTSWDVLQKNGSKAEYNKIYDESLRIIESAGHISSGSGPLNLLLPDWLSSFDAENKTNFSFLMIPELLTLAELIVGANAGITDEEASSLNDLRVVCAKYLNKVSA